ncbi:hypothetical protein IJJ08_02650 [bacterium]|nr:hypothetical protein [bacterium]
MYTQSVYAASGNKTMKLKDVAVGKVVQVGELKFVKVAANQYLALAPTCVEELSIGESKTFTYTGAPEEFLTCVGSTYRLEVWGASGGNGGAGRGGYGGYAVGFISPRRNHNLYIVVGEGGKSIGGNVPGGYFTTPATYNGGGQSVGTGADTTNRKRISGSGGGATHIGIDIDLGVLANYSNQRDAIVIAAGGGGGNGMGYSGYGGDGGGFQTNLVITTGYSECAATGATQTTGGLAGNPWSCEKAGTKSGIFGRGGNPPVSDGAGGGGGWYGGGGANYSMASGGTGYISSSYLVGLENNVKHMTCYNCPESSESATLTLSNTCAQEDPISDCAKIGDGAARITRLN